MHPLSTSFKPSLPTLLYTMYSLFVLIEIMKLIVHISFRFLFFSSTFLPFTYIIGLQIIIDEIEKKGIALTKLLLQPLQLQHTTSLVQDVFCVSLEQAAPLAKLVQDKTNGNPFFVCQFLRTIVQEGLVTFGYTDRRWKWSMDQLLSAQYMDNVVDFMLAKIRKLPQATQSVIQLAACLGNTFSTAELSTVSELPISDTIKHLSIAVAGGFLHVLPQASTDSFMAPPEQKAIESDTLPLPCTDHNGTTSDEEVKVNGNGHMKAKLKEHSLPENLSELAIPSSSLSTSPPMTPTEMLESAEARYKFVHDRVQEAFYIMVNEQERKHIHLKIAHILLNKGIEEQDSLFTVVHHYNLASDLVLTFPPENKDRELLVSLNYEAARKAKHSNAIEPARGYLVHARKALPADSFERDYEQTFALLLLLGEVSYVCGDHQEAYNLFDLLLEKGKGNIDKARVHILAASCYETSSNYALCIHNCASAAALFGVDLMPHASAEHVRAVLDEIFVEQRARTATIAELGNLPFMDEEHELVMEALYTALAAAFVSAGQGGHYLFYYIAGRMCLLTIQHGIGAFSANAFACFAGALAQNHIPGLYEFGAVSMTMLNRIKVRKRWL
jgi:predicted ATPase